MLMRLMNPDTLAVADVPTLGRFAIVVPIDKPRALTRRRKDPPSNGQKRVPLSPVFLNCSPCRPAQKGGGYRFSVYPEGGAASAHSSRRDMGRGFDDFSHLRTLVRVKPCRIGSCVYQVCFDTTPEAPAVFLRLQGLRLFRGVNICHMRVSVFSMTGWHPGRTSPRP